ncbi:MAG: hypothetical protein WBS24_03545 [Terriglobales bacterium]
MDRFLQKENTSWPLWALDMVRPLRSWSLSWNCVPLTLPAAPYPLTRRISGHTQHNFSADGMSVVATLEQVIIRKTVRVAATSVGQYVIYHTLRIPSGTDDLRKSGEFLAESTIPVVRVEDGLYHHRTDGRHLVSPRSASDTLTDIAASTAKSGIDH